MKAHGARWGRPAAESLEAAKRRFTELLGQEGVQAEGPLFSEFHDPFEGPGAVDHQPSLVVQPASVEEVQGVLRLATELGVHLWTSSMGRNFGYGGSAPVVDGGVVLNLRRMNRVLEIDVAQGYAMIEPGVSFAQLYEALREQDAPLMMSVPDLGWGSITGNALEHGYGYNVMGDHASAVCGMEVVLADGTLLRTGQGALPGSPLWACHRRGYGPSLDSLFMQSNFGVVTKAGLWLMPRPEIFATGTITCQGEDDIVPLVDMIRGLLREGVLQGVPMIVGSPDDADGEEAGAGRFTNANLRQVLRPGRWSVRIGLYGDARMVATRRAILESAVAGLEGAVLDLRTYPGDAGRDVVEPRDLIPAGIPNQVLLERLRAVFGETLGHMDFSPVVPLTGEFAQRIDRLVRATVAKYGLIAPVGFLLNQRSMVSACLVMFDASDAARVALARDAVREMYDRIAEWGCAPYRSHISLADHVAGKFAFNGHALGQTYSRIKDALDPAGILSPGNHGIWPGSPAAAAD